MEYILLMIELIFNTEKKEGKKIGKIKSPLKK